MKSATAIVSAVAMAVAAMNTSAQTTSDADKVKSAIVAMVKAVDAKQWSAVRNEFADQVLVDYSSMTG